jgi:hypothetical protein
VRAGSGGRGGEGRRGGGGEAFAQGTNLCVYVPLQGGGDKWSALHFASCFGLKSVVAQMLSLGADAALKDNVRACSYMSTFMYSVLVCTFVNALLIRVSLFIMHIIQAYHVCL